MAVRWLTRARLGLMQVDDPAVSHVHPGLTDDEQFLVGVVGRFQGGPAAVWGGDW